MENEIKDKLPGRQGLTRRTATDSRPFLEVLLWRGLPPEFGSRNSFFVRFGSWDEKAVFEWIFKELSGSFDLEWAQLDGKAVLVHAKAVGGNGSAAQPLGRSRGMSATRVAAHADTPRANWFPGHRQDLPGLLPPLNGLDVQAPDGDNAFGADWLAEELEARGCTFEIQQDGCARPRQGDV